MGGCFKIPEKSIESPYIDYRRLNIDSLFDLWCAGQVNQMICKFNKFCEQKKCSKLSSKQLQQFFPLLKQYYPQESFHKKIFLLLDHNNDKAINSRQILWGLTLILKLQVKKLSEVLFSLYRTNNHHFLNETQFQQFLSQNTKLLNSQSHKKRSMSSITFPQFNDFIQQYFNLSKFRQIFDCTRSMQQIQISKRLKQKQGQINLNRGAAVYIIDSKWFIEWKQYMQIKYSVPEINFKQENRLVEPKRRSTVLKNDSILIKMLDDQKPNDKQSTTFHYKKPSKIDNSHLEGQFQGQLKQNLQIYQHFLFVPQKLWISLKQQYGGEKEFKRIYPHFNQLSVTEVFINSKSKFIEGNIKKRTISLQQTISDILGIQNMKHFVVYKRNLGQLSWTKLIVDSVVAEQSVMNNSFLCKVQVGSQNEFIKRYNSDTRSKINYGEALSISDGRELIMAYVVQILKDGVKIHFKGKSYESDVIVQEDEFVKVAQNSLFKYDANSQFPGLINLGNTCYMNSVLQCIISTPVFDSFLVKASYKDLLYDQKQTKQYPVIRQLSELSKLISTSSKFIKPSIFVHLIKTTLTSFDNYEQHDAQQFLVSLLNHLEGELTIGKISIGNVNSLDLIGSHVKEKYCPIQKFFGGVEKRVMKCQKCKNTVIKNELFYSLGLFVPQNQYGYYSVLYYPHREGNSEFEPLMQYGAKVKKTATFKQYIDIFSALIGKPTDVLMFYELTKSQFRKFFRDYYYEKTLQELRINPSDLICVFQIRTKPIVRKKHPSEKSKRDFVASLRNEDLIDVLSYTEWQIGVFKQYDQQSKKVKYQSMSLKYEIDEKQVAPFLSKTCQKYPYSIEVLHRKYNTQRQQFQYFLKPFVISVHESLQWSDTTDIINKQAARFVDNIYWQKRSNSNNNSTLLGSQLKKNESEKNLLKRKQQNKLPLFSYNTEALVKPTEAVEDLLFIDEQNLKTPYIIRVVNRSNEMCAICNKRITQVKKQVSSPRIEYCKGCQYQNEKPISVMFDIRRIMIVLDWYCTIAINPEANVAVPDASFTKIFKERQHDRLKIQDCFKSYASIQQNIQMNCQKCKFPTSSSQCLISKTPNILVIHLKRFRYVNGYFSKIQSPVECPLQISLQKITSDTTPCKYQLYGIVCHLGSGFGGHYYSYIKKSRTKWIVCDDHITKTIQDIQKQVNPRNIYLLFYKKIQVQGSLLTLSL